MSNAANLQEQADHIEPGRSPQHLDLRAAVREAGHDDETLRDILWLVNANDRLLGLRKIARNLSFLLRNFLCSETGSSTSGSAAQLFLGWEPVLSWIATKLPAETCREGNHRTNPNRGKAFLRNPLWSALWHEPKDAKFAAAYGTLQFQVLYAHARYLWTESGNDSRLCRLAYEQYGRPEMWDVFPDSPYLAALRLRRLAEANWIRVLGPIDNSLPPRSYVEAFGAIEFPAEATAELAKTWPEYRAEIRSFLARAHGFEPWSLGAWTRKNAILVRTPGTIKSEDVSFGDSDDPETCQLPNSRIVTISSALPPDIAEEAFQSDLDPDEIVDHDECFLAENGREDLQQIAIDAALSARGQYRHVQMRHQLFPFDYNIPAAQEMRNLLSALDQIWLELGDERTWDPAKCITAETVALIEIMVWYGFPLSRVHQMVVIGDSEPGNSSKSTVPIGTLAYDCECAEWIVPIDPPPYKRVIVGSTKQAHPHEPWLPLQDVAGVGRFVDVLNRARNRRSSSPIFVCPSHHCALFQDELKTYELSIRNLLQRVNGSEGRVTLRRIGAFLLNRLVAVRGDLMAGSLITGQFSALTRTERYYACYPVSSLRKLYYRVASAMIRQIRCEQPPPETPPSFPSLWHGYVGARLCARDRDVKLAIGNLGESIEALCEVKNQTIAYHNLLTLHSVLLFCFCTSCRPVRAPYLRRDRIDEETGFAYLCDKDDDAHHKTRLIWVPDLCQQQMKLYEQHCRSLENETPAIGKWPDPCFFFADPLRAKEAGKRELEPVRPGTLANHLSPFLQLPLNFYRKFLRHRLLKSHCPPEIVMAWLGHAFAGEEIWNARSALSPLEYRASLDTYLIPILEDLGWKAR